ncbi:hypothetical protein MNBD_ALPHA06-606, partial [hydrothermal vent metagenome]
MKSYLKISFALVCLIATSMFFTSATAQDLRAVPKSHAQEQLSYAPVVKKAAP